MSLRRLTRERFEESGAVAPSVIRLALVAVVAAVVLFVALPLAARAVGAGGQAVESETQAAGSAAPAVDYSSEEAEFVRLLNEYREGLGLQPLMVSDILSDAAEKHSHDMGTYGFFNHITQESDFFPVGCDGGGRIVRCGYPYNTGWGECIAAGYSKASAVLDAWKNSPIHNAVMTRDYYVVVGIGLVYVAGDSLDHGYYWTADFGFFADETAHWLGDEPVTTTTTAVTATTTTTTTTAPTTTTTATSTTSSTTTTATSTTSSTTTTVPSPTTTTTPSTPSTTSTTFPGTTSTTSTTLSGPAFADVPVTYRFYEPITRLAAAGVVDGYTDGRFHPEGVVTRAQLAKIMVSALDAHTPEIENADAPTFSDVVYTGGAYPFDYVEEAAGLGIVQGRSDGTFLPQAGVTRLQLALMVVRAGGDGLAGPPPGYSCLFTDVPLYGRATVAKAYYNGLLSGKTAATFDPYSPATRGQVAKIVYELTRQLGL